MNTQGGPAASRGMTDALAYEHNGDRISAHRFYELACDPRRSVAVEACAGAGKTWMLVSRILRALLAGTQPHEILAITFTKKAAGEMRQRLNEWLEEFAHAPAQQLAQELALRGVAHPTAEEIEGLRALYGCVLQAGRPVQVRTFHSWFAALLRNAPLAVMERLGLPVNYELLEDDQEAADLVWRRFHVAVAADPQARADFEACVAAHGRSQTRKALQAALAKRVEFAKAIQYDTLHGAIKAFDEQFPQFAGLAHPEQALEGDLARARWHARARELGRQDGKTAPKAAQAVIDAFEDDDLHRRAALLRKAFFVAGEDRLTQHLLKFDAARQAEGELQSLCAAQLQHAAWQHHHRMARLARVLIAQFSRLKREHGWIDMNDVEQAAQEMLSDDVLSGWLQEKLDARVRHLLIDEFQDTNPLQWQALQSWLQSYAGAGGNRPGVFIVGDPKQSIYRFRRAEPRVFRSAKDFVREAFDGDVLSCDHTRRNAPEIVGAVNAVMGKAQDDGQYDGFRDHTTAASLRGRVAALPQLPRDAVGGAKSGPASDDEPLAWRDSLTMPREVKEEKLVALECRQAAAWVAGRIADGIAPGDIMVLARRRDRLGAMEDELRRLHIAAQQPEKSRLGEAPEAQDVVALVDALVSPAHDLSLARALKSPLFGIGDEALVELALAARRERSENRSASWYELLQRESGLRAELRAAGARLAQWKGLVDTLPPHDALDLIYRQGDVVARFAAAAPPALRDAVVRNVRALLGAALAVDGGRYATPYAFVRALKSGTIQAPPLAQSQVVRLLTVHGAKGLEASHVLILDADSAAPRAETMGVIVEWPGEAPGPTRFAFIASETKPPPCSTWLLEVEREERQREELNTLYVAMTRAKQELVISSSEPHAGNEHSWWQRLQPVCEALEAPVHTAAPDAAIATAFTLPRLPEVTVKPRPRTALDREPDSEASRFGQAMHRLLEAWTGAGRFDPQAVRRVAREFRLSRQQAQQAAGRAEAILTGEGAWAWNPEVVDWEGNEVPMQHAGAALRIDRLVRKAASGEWWVLDFKSHARPQDDPLLIEQMSGYRAAVQAAYPDDVVRAAFLTGQGRLVAVP